MDEERLRRELADLKSQEIRVRTATGFGAAKNSKAQPSQSRAMRYSLLGAEFAAIFFAFIYGGHALDQRLGTKPWLLLVGIFVGFGIALYRLIFVARKLGEENARD